MNISVKSRKMAFQSTLGAAALAGASLLAAPPANAANVYDSGGFEGFTPTQVLEGQVGGTPSLQWRSRVGTTREQTTVEDGFGVNGTRGVVLRYGTPLTKNGAAVYTDNFTTVPAPVNTAANPFVAVFSDILVTPATSNTPDSPTTQSPLFGLNASAMGGSNITAPLTVGAVYVDSGTSHVLYQSNVGGEPVIFDSGTTVSLDEYHSFALSLNYLTSTYNIQVDGVLINPAPIDFAEPATTYSNTDLLAINPVAGQTDSAFAYYDNYSVIAIPEPASLGVVGLVGIACTLRRRRSAR